MLGRMWGLAADMQLSLRQRVSTYKIIGQVEPFMETARFAWGFPMSAGPGGNSNAGGSIPDGSRESAPREQRHAARIDDLGVEQLTFE